MTLVLIRNAYLIDPSQNLEGEYDLLIENGIIKDVQRRGTFAGLTGHKEILADGTWVTPGFIDLHVHLRDPGLEWKETIATGARAAIAGGYTSICCMPNSRPANHSAEITEYILNRAKTAGYARVLPIGAVSLDLKGKELAPLSELSKAGCVAFSDDGEPIYDAGMMRRALEWASMLGVRISCHEEDKCLSCGGCANESPLTLKLGLAPVPTVAEDVMVARDIELARYTKGKIHICHVSSARAVELIRRAKNDGIDVTCEVTPHHLTLTEDHLEGYDTNYKMSPPLRTEEERQALIKGIQDGTIDAIASDHAPHEVDSKSVAFEEASLGILGLQTSLPVMLDFVHSGKISKMQAVSMMATRPAECFGLPYGTLKKGAPADFVLIDPKHKWLYKKEANLSKSFNSPFFGREFQGCAKMVFVAGEEKWRMTY